MKKKNKLIIAIFVMLFLIIGIISGSVIYVKSSLKPTRAFLNGEICGEGNIAPCDITLFTVDEGSYGKETIEKLADVGIIKNSDIVYYYNRIFGSSNFYAGTYEIPHTIDGRSITLDEVFAYISNANNAVQDTITLKFAEGDFLESFAEVIAENTNISAEEAFRYWNNADVVRSYMDDYPFLTEEIFNNDVRYYLEGYLFPDTYEVFRYSTIDDITRKMLDETLRIYNENIDAFNNHDLSIHDIFTLASMVQWESGDVDDSPVIAGVFMNRLEDGEQHDVYGLQSTVTACYAFSLSKEECYQIGDTTQITGTYDPYNTYQIEGLPPGPVCNPNEMCILAALYADRDHDYYYFSADLCNGGTAFAKTLYEHQLNIDRYFIPCS